LVSDWIMIITLLVTVGFVILSIRMGWIKVDFVLKKDIDALCGKKDD
jgi:hypothetical protein